MTTNLPTCAKCSEPFAGPSLCIEGGSCTTGDADPRHLASDLIARAEMLRGLSTHLEALAVALEGLDVPADEVEAHPTVAEARRCLR